MFSFKPAQVILVTLLGGALAACGSTATPSVPASVSAPSAAASAPASSAAASASAAAKPGAVAVVGPSAPGPYSASGSVTETGGQASLQGTDALKWQPNTIMAKAGDKVTLSIQNSGSTAHTFISPSLGVTSAQDVPTGKTSTVTFTVPSAPGAYQFWCNIPGHAESGMVGEVIVQ